MLENQATISNDHENKIFHNRIEWISIKQAAADYPIGLHTLYKHKANGIPARKLGRKLVFKRSELEEWLERWAA